MAAYIVGERGTWRHAALIGLSVTATHTAGVVALGVILTTTTVAAPERLYPWFGLMSGLLLAGIGVTLVRRALSQPAPAPGARGPRLARRPAGRGRAGPADTGRGGATCARWSSSVPPPCTRLDTASPSQPTAGHATTPRPRRCPSTTTRRWPPAPLDQLPARPAPPPRRPHPRRPRPRPATPAWPTTTAGGCTRTGPWIRRWAGSSLMAVGFAGGLVPNPSALVVLLGAIALGRTWFGLLLVVAYGVGMAVTLTSAGSCSCGRAASSTGSAGARPPVASPASPGSCPW